MEVFSNFVSAKKELIHKNNLLEQVNKDLKDAKKKSLIFIPWLIIIFVGAVYLLIMSIWILKYIYKIADEQMYKNKAEMKKGNNVFR